MPSTNLGIKAFTAFCDIEENRRVKLRADGSIEHCGANEVGIGTSLYNIEAEKHGDVKLNNHAGTVSVCSSGSFGVGDEVFCAIDGKIGALQTTAGDYICFGIAHESATEIDDLVEIQPNAVGKIITVTAA